jgi:hypothetical protein
MMSPADVLGSDWPPTNTERAADEGRGGATMDYLTQAKTFLRRAKDTASAAEKESHLGMAVAMIEKAIEQRSEAPDTLEFSWQEEEVLRVFAEKNARPSQDVNPQALLLAWGTRGPVDDLWAALDRLEERKLVRRNESETTYQLSDNGYAITRGG